MLVRHLPAESATHRGIVGEAATWTLTDHLLAAAVDTLRAANWQRGGKGARPKPLARPGINAEADQSGAHHYRPRQSARNAAEFREWLAANREDRGEEVT